MSPAQNKDRRQVQSLERENREASVKGDHAFFNALAVSNFMAIDPQGKLSTKADVLKSRQRHEMKYDSIEVDNEQVRVYGNAAIVTGTSSVKGHHLGSDSSGQYRYTRVYVKVQGEWQIASSQSTRISS
jgi:ketosteroid isomerase-like protein